jgi:hypothetical protein
LFFTGDTNTGLFSPGADQIGISTGGTSRIVVDASGNVNIDSNTFYVDAGNNRIGIGVNNPGRSLDIVSSDTWIRTARTSGNAWIIGPGVQDAFRIFDDTAGAERFRIEATTGNVGIGTTVPDTALHINGTFDSSSAFATTNSNKGLTINSSLGDATGAQYGVVFSTSQGTNNDYPVAGIMAIPVAPSVGIGGSLSFQTHTSADLTLAERARIDSSGRLLVGTSSSRSVTVGTSGGWDPRVQVTKTGLNGANIAAYSFSTYAVDLGGGLGIGPDVILARSNSDTEGTQTAIANNMLLGRITFNGSDGTAFQSGAFIAAASDGQTWASSDCPTRLVFSTTADGAASPTERYRITNDGVLCHDQPAPATYAAAATLTVADLKTGIITYTGTAATLTLPTGTLTEGGFAGIYTNMAFEWSVINTGAGICTIGAGTAHTIVGSAAVAIGASARFTSRRTAANTFVSYRLS